MSKKNKLEPNWDIVKPTLVENSSTAVNNAYKEYGKAIMDFIWSSGFDMKDGTFYQYAGTQEKLEEKSKAFSDQIEKHRVIMKAVTTNDRETMLAVLNGEFW